jgi:serine/threonine protein kinase
MKLLKRIKERYFKNRIIEADVFVDYVTTDGKKIDKPVLKLRRKKQQVRKDVKILKEFDPPNGDTLYAKLKAHPHKNVMAVYDFNSKFLFVEYIDGPMLYHTIEMEEKELYKGYDGIEFWFPKNPYTPGMEEAIVAGIEHLHSKNIYHGDVKPNNIMVNKEGCVKIIDFHASLDLSPEYIDYGKDLRFLKKTLKGLSKYKDGS